MGGVRKIPTSLANLRPNDPCPCGSGKSVKLCCGAAFRTFQR